MKRVVYFIGNRFLYRIGVSLWYWFRRHDEASVNENDIGHRMKKKKIIIIKYVCCHCCWHYVCLENLNNSDHHSWRRVSCNHLMDIIAFSKTVDSIHLFWILISCSVSIHTSDIGMTEVISKKVWRVRKNMHMERYHLLYKSTQIYHNFSLLLLPIRIFCFYRSIHF